ncbi:MAG TPA: LLM class F420-dependent oxidoreductase [Chloroflexota bacterium]|nr:LLM class F420-dependent oxidoreductase [Chloroflexota bacterium]
MPKVKIGVHVRPQHTTIDALRAAWKAADEMGVDTITTWDHFHPLQGDPAGAHFECWSLLSAMAVDTKRAQIGSMVCAVNYRNPDLLADIARTVDHLSGGRLILGIGAGNSQRDHDDYDIPFGEPRDRLRALKEALPRIKERLAKLNPPPIGKVPIMIGGGGEQVTLRLTAQYADLWNGGGTPDGLRHKNQVLDEWCRKLGRNPADIERTANIPAAAPADQIQAFADAGADRLQLQWDHPFDTKPIEAALKLRG